VSHSSASTLPSNGGVDGSRYIPDRSTDAAHHIRAALGVRADLERAQGVLQESTSALFDRFGFIPSSIEDQRYIETALTAAGVTVRPIDDTGRTLKLTALDSPTVGIGGGARRGPAPTFCQNCGAHASGAFCAGCGHDLRAGDLPRAPSVQPQQFSPPTPDPVAPTFVAPQSAAPAPVPQTVYVAAPVAPAGTVSRGTNGMAIAALVLGIVWLYGIGSILAIIFAAVGLKQIAERGQGGRGLAIAGLVLGIIGAAFLAFFLLVLSVTPY
jgi:hypothetical protein